jgi:hypothetical protein
MKPVTAYAASLEDLVFCPGHYQHLAEQRVPLDIADFFQEVRSHSSGGLAEELGDVEDTKLGRRAETDG